MGEEHRIWDQSTGEFRDLAADEWQLESHWSGALEVHGERPPGHQWVLVVPRWKLEAAEARVAQLTEALRIAADDLGKASNQFAGLLPDGINKDRFAEKEARARAVLEAHDEK
jgi:hypothetical protein